MIFWVEAENFFKNPNFILKKLLVLKLFPGEKFLNLSNLPQNFSTSQKFRLYIHVFLKTYLSGTSVFPLSLKNKNFKVTILELTKTQRDSFFPCLSNAFCHCILLMFHWTLKVLNKSLFTFLFHQYLEMFICLQMFVIFYFI